MNILDFLPSGRTVLKAIRRACESGEPQLVDYWGSDWKKYVSVIKPVNQGFAVAIEFRAWSTRQAAQWIRESGVLK